MKDRFSRMSPFVQLMVLILVGAVAFILISILSATIVSSLYPSMPIDDITTQRIQFPVQFMMLYYVPFQAGFLLIPGLLYMKWSDFSERLYRLVSVKGIVWSILLFAAVFFLLPFLSEINFYLIDVFGIQEGLVADKLISDEMMKDMLGSTSDLSFMVGLLIIGLLTGVAEEIAFRRLLFDHMLKNTNRFWLSVVASAFIFAVLHFNYLQFIPLMSFGIGLALIYHFSGTFWVGALLHAGNNMLNLWWLSTDRFPHWMESIDLKTTIPSTLLLMGLIYYQFFRKSKS